MSRNGASRSAVERSVPSVHGSWHLAPDLISPTPLPRLLCVVVMAFAPYEAQPLLGAVKLFRGFAIQLAYRWATGQVVADPNGKAVLLWSVPFRGPVCRSVRRELFGALVAASVGTVMEVVCSGIFLLPFGIVLMAAGVGIQVLTVAGLTIIATSLAMTCWRALLAHRSERALTARLPAPSNLRLRIDCLAAVPARSGHGGHLLDAFLGNADACDAEVVLHCSQRNVAFYRRHGFHVAAAECPDGQRLMLRKARSSRPLMGQGRNHLRPATIETGDRGVPAATKGQRPSG
jgi:hypothetical protein